MAYTNDLSLFDLGNLDIQEIPVDEDHEAKQYMVKMYQRLRRLENPSTHDVAQDVISSCSEQGASVSVTFSDDVPEKIDNTMNGLKDGWFSELSTLWPGVCLSLQVDKVLHSEKSEFQDIMVLQTKSHGKALVLDGIIQCTESDEFSYQEMISFIPLCSHPTPKKVLIVGGGDGGVAREVAKHPAVESIHQVEIDEKVMKVSKTYLPFMGKGLTHPKLTVHVADGFKFMAQHRQEFDVIITDSSDPVGPAMSLFQQSYFELMKQALRPGGIVCSQAGTVWSNLKSVVETFNHCRNVFATSSFAYSAVPTYPTGQIGYVLGSLNVETNFKEPLRIFTEEELNSMSLRYYSPEIHRAAFVLPRFADKALYSQADTKNCK